MEVEIAADDVPEGVDGALGGFSQMGFQLGECLLDRVELGAVGPEEEQRGVDALDGGSDILDLAATRTRYGSFRIYILLRREGWVVNHERVYRLYPNDGLNLRLKKIRRNVSAANRERQPAVLKALDRWAYENGVTLDFSRPGKPTENAFVESFNGRFRDECLNAHWFLSMTDARAKIEAWRRL